VTPRSLACMLLIAAAARADVLHVPGEFPTIAVAVEAAGPGDTILISAGTYDEQVVVFGADGLTIRGQGKVELTGLTNEIGLILDNCVNTTVEKLRFRGLSLGLRVTNCQDVTVRKCRAEEMAELGFQLLDGTNTLFDRCRVDGAIDHGLQIVSGTGCLVRRCTFEDVNFGLQVQAVSALEVDHLRVERASQSGLQLGDGCAGVDVHHARILDSAAGFDVAADAGIFRHDLVADPAGVGIQCSSGAANNLFEHERVVSSGGDAFLVGGTGQELRSCRAVKAGAAGFRLADVGQHLVQDCRATSPASYGLLVNGGCGDCSLLDNRVTHAPENGLETDGDRTVLVGNRATGTGIDGIRVGSELNVLTGNHAHGSGGFDLHDLVGSSTYADNHFGTESLP